MAMRSVRTFVASLALCVLGLGGSNADAQQAEAPSEEALRAAAPPPPPAVVFGDGIRGRVPDTPGGPVEPALDLDVQVVRKLPGRTTYANPPLRATLTSIVEAGGTPALVFAPELRLIAFRTVQARRTQRQRQGPPGRAVVAAPGRAGAGDSARVIRPVVVGAPVAEGGAADAGRIGAVVDPVAGLELPAEMPAILWPVFVDDSCTGNQPGTSLWEAKRAWALAHHHTWRAYQLLEFIGESASQFRDDYWSDGHVLADTSANWSPSHWFGGYAGQRQSAIREVVGELWERFRTAEFDGVPIRVKCPTPGNEPDNPGNICFTHQPAAHHVVKGWVNICAGSFADDVSAESRAFTLTHELLHHATVSWQEGDLWKSAFLGDTQLHGHGDACLEGVRWEKMYGYDKVRHLATAGGCWHRNLAMRNNDTYAHFITRLGGAVRGGKLKKFPTEGTPWQTPGESGNECSENPVPPPGEDFQDPEACFKAGNEWVCPGGGGGGGSMVLPDACLSMPTGAGG